MAKCINYVDILEMVYHENSLVHMAEVRPELDADEFPPVLEFIRKLQYNEFDGNKVAKFLEKLIGDLNKPHYERGSDLRYITFGRAYSPILKLHFSKAKTDEKTVMKIAAKASKALKTDECDTEGMEIRLWWD